MGQGGYSDIYRVTAADGGGRVYALKHLRLAGDAEHIADVQREAKIMARVGTGGGWQALAGRPKLASGKPCGQAVQSLVRLQGLAPPLAAGRATTQRFAAARNPLPSPAARPSQHSSAARCRVCGPQGR